MKSGIPLKYVILSLAILVVIFASCLFSFLNYFELKRQALINIDEKLLIAIDMAREALPENYHDNIKSKNSISQKDFLHILKKNDQLCLRHNLEYVWSLMQDGEVIRFTSSTSQNKKDHKVFARFFEKHTNPEAYSETFRTMQPQSTTITDKWGKIRAMLVPFKDAKGRKYLFGASMRTTNVETILDNILIKSFCTCVALIILCIIISFILSNAISRPVSLLANKMQGISKGELLQKMSYSFLREQRMLAESFNNMSVTIHNAVDELEESNGNLQVTLGAIGDAVIVTNCEGSVERMNVIAEELTGWSIEEAKGKLLKDVFKIIHSETREEILNPVEKYLMTGEVVPLANHTALFSRDGTERQIADSASPIISESDKFLGIILVFRDVTKEYSMQEAIRLSEAGLRQIIDTMPHIIYVINAENRYLLVNQALADTVGKAPEQIIGKKVTEILPDNAETKAMLATDQEVISSNKLKLVNEEIFTLPDGKELTFQTIKVPFVALFNNQPAVLGIAMDITKQRHLEDQLRHAQKMDAIGQLAAGVAHDFNNMLHAITGTTELVEDHVKEDAEAKHLLDSVLSICSRASELTNKLLAFSSKKKVNKKNGDIHEAVNDAIDILNRSLDKLINIDLQLNAETCNADCDLADLQNALLNLAINAGDAMPQGGNLTVITSNIELDQEFCKSSSFELKPGLFICISFRDDGTGMNQETLSRIFEPFYSTKAPGKGTGLGLTAVYGTILDHHGAITVYSELEKGTEFRILLPVSPEMQTVDIKQKVSPPKVISKARILVVDDEEMIRNMAKAILTRAGYEVLTADNGRHALEIYRQEYKNIGLVILDMIMPDMNGEESFKEIQKINPAAKVIISSGFTKDASLDQLLENGLGGYVEKPYRRSELFEIIDECLKK